MNGIGIRTGSADEIQRLADFAGGDWRLGGWFEHEYRLMAARFDPDADNPARGVAAGVAARHHRVT